MPDILTQVLATPGLGWMAMTIAAAGLVRGFTGFGTAMIFVPVASLFLPVPQVVFVITATGIVSTATLLPSAWGQADRAEVGALALAAAVAVPAGLALLTRLDPVLLRWIAAAVIVATLVAVVTGWRWQGNPGWPGRAAIGGGAGLVGGMTGLTGPVVIVFYLASARDVTRVRANTILFLAALDAAIIVNLVLGGLTGQAALWIAAVLSVPYLCTTLAGKALFDPRHERVYRGLAYSVIAGAVVAGLPLFD